jgi:mono/diheme cytochrome c family protein
MHRFLTGAIACCAIVLLVVAAAGKQRASSRLNVNELYNKNCARCHGSDGRGDTPSGHLYQAPDFTSADWWNKDPAHASTRSQRAVVTKGKGGMPGFAKKLTRAEINVLVDRVRKFRK